MDPYLLRLAQHALEAPAWRWLPGMAGIELEPLPRQRWASAEQAPIRRRIRVGEWSPSLAVQLTEGCIPDLADGPTRGALLELVREAWNDPELAVVRRRPADPIPLPGGADQGSAVPSSLVCTRRRLVPPGPARGRAAGGGAPGGR